MLFALVSLATVAIVVYLGYRKSDHDFDRPKFDRKLADDLNVGLRRASEHARFAEVAAANPDVRGERLWRLCLAEGLIDRVLVGRLTSVSSATDTETSWEAILADECESWCSYTAPRLGSLREVLSMTGEQRVVVFAFNSRNWNNARREGVLVMWSDGGPPHYMTREDFSAYDITPEEWADPSGKLFGKRAPFQFTYE